MNIIQENNIRPGDALVRSKSFLGLIDHYGLYVGDYQVIENHPLHGVRLVSLAEFLQGRKFQKIKRFPGNDWARTKAIDKAYSMIGAEYDAFNFNCEHFVNLIHEIGMTSIQADTARGILITLFAIVCIAAISGK